MSKKERKRLLVEEKKKEEERARKAANQIEATAAGKETLLTVSVISVSEGRQFKPYLKPYLAVRPSSVKPFPNNSFNSAHIRPAMLKQLNASLQLQQPVVLRRCWRRRTRCSGRSPPVTLARWRNNLPTPSSSSPIYQRKLTR